MNFQTNIFLLALVSGYKGTCVWWQSVTDEEGFATLDISTLKSSSKKCYKNGPIQSQPFYLSIQPGLLESGLSYKFKINAENRHGSVATSTFIVETLEELHTENLKLEVRILFLGLNS